MKLPTEKVAGGTARGAYGFITKQPARWHGKREG